MATGGRLSIHLSTSGQTTKAEILVRTKRISRVNQRSPLSYFQNPGHVVLNFIWSLWVKGFCSNYSGPRSRITSREEKSI